MALHPDPDQFTYYSGYSSFLQFIGTFTTTLAVSGTVPAAPPNNFASFQTNLSVPSTNFSTQIFMESTVNPGNKYLVENIQIENLVRAGSSNYNLEINVATRPSTGTVFFDAAINNPTGGVLTLVSETITWDVKVFVSPFV